MDKQVVSKQRLADHGEVLTGKREVNAMLDLVKQETERIESRFLEPACDHSPEAQKVIRLIDYFTRLALLRTKITRNIEDYQNVLWVKDIPQQKGCFTQAWRRDENYDSDVWIEIQTRREPELPSVPPLCKDWVEEFSLRNNRDLPKLLPEITRQIENPDWREDSGQPEVILHSERLEDHPRV